jgi:hypothetical protein
MTEVNLILKKNIEWTPMVDWPGHSQYVFESNGYRMVINRIPDGSYWAFSYYKFDSIERSVRSGTLDEILSVLNLRMKLLR